MYIKIVKPSDIAVDDIRYETNYALSGYHVAVAGVGKTGVNAVCHQKLSGCDMEQIDSLTMFTYDKTDTSPQYKELCKQACRECFWLFVLVDPEDEDAIDRACELAEYSQNETDTHRHDIRACIMLEKYHGTQIEQMLQKRFDKIIFVEGYDQFFLPVEMLFVHSEGAIHIGIDYADYYNLVKASKSLFLTRAVNTDVNELESILQTRIKQKLQTYSVKHFNILSYFSCDNDGPLESIVDIAWNIQSFAKNMDNEMEHSFNSVFRRSDDKSILAYILLCVKPPKAVSGT